uniref:HIRA interacting protein 3 n=1 Tax=Capra hircus TaxID=9925 RepID=A0A452E8Y2_CAPHI
MARENEMQEFTRSFFQGHPDLSTLTHSIVRRRFLAHAGRDHLEPEEKQALKRLVEEELLKMQVDEASAKEERLRVGKKAKRSSAPCRDPERKRFRFNSESEPSSAAPSPDRLSPSAKNGMAADVTPTKDESPNQASKKATESSDEEQQRDLNAKIRLEKEGSARKRKESKGRTRKKPGTKTKQAPGKASGSRKQAREESEDSEEEPAQGPGKKGAKSHQESAKESEEETLTKKKENREEEEDWKPTAQSSGGKRSVREERSCKQKSRAARLLGDQGDREEQKGKAAASSGDSSEEDEEPLVQRKRKDRTQGKGGKRQSGSSKEDGEDSPRKVKRTTGKTAKEGSISGEASDSEKEVSNSEAEGSPKERKNRSSKKSSKKGRTRSSSSSSTDGSPESKGRKLLSSIARLALVALVRTTPSCWVPAAHARNKCRALKEQREEAAEVASLDINNIISNSDRPRRRTAWNPSGEAAPPGELYCRTLDSDEERPRPPPPDWSHLRGIISSDGESN